MADFVRAWKTGKTDKSARISFATPELLWKVLTTKRWELLKATCGHRRFSGSGFPAQPRRHSRGKMCHPFPDS